MNETELLELVKNGESSRVEFKRDDCRPADIAKEMSAFLNLHGGAILLGVEDDGWISGLNRPRGEAEQWIMNIARNNLDPPTIPAWTSISIEDYGIVGIVELPSDSAGKPYRARKSNAWVTYIRVGSGSREATRSEEARFYQAAQLVHYELRAVQDLEMESFDLDRVDNYFRVVMNRPGPERSDVKNWRQILLNSDLLVASGSTDRATVAGLLLFGKNPNRRVQQAGVTATVFPGKHKDYNTIDEEHIRGPLVPIISPNGGMVDTGVIDRTVNFVERNMGSDAWLEGGRRIRKKDFPRHAVREAVVNALVHRDYAYEGTDVEVSLYSDRLEVISPGRLPNGVTVEKMKEGVVRVARNGLLREILRDYRNVEHRGMGVRIRIVEAIRDHNGTEADLIEEDDRFMVRLWKKRQ